MSEKYDKESIKSSIFDVARATPWLVITLLMLAVVGYIAPHQLGVLAYTLCKISAGAFLGYWIDRSIFYYGRPMELSGDKQAFLHSCYRRAIIISATVLAAAIAV